MAKSFSFASKFNKTSFGIDTTDFPFVKLTDIFNSENEGGGDVVHPINGMYVHKSQLGDSPVIIDAETKRLVDLPQFTGDTIREILEEVDGARCVGGSAASMAAVFRLRYQDGCRRFRHVQRAGGDIWLV